jgi:hypothetical protein
VSRPEDRGVRSLTSRREQPDEQDVHQPAAPAPDRRHDGAQLAAGGTPVDLEFAYTLSLLALYDAQRERRMRTP